MVNGGGWIIFFSFFKKNVGNFSSFAFATNILVLFLVSSLFFRENLEGQEGKLHSGIQKKKERNISFNSSGDGEKWQLQGGQGDHEKCFVGDEREKKWIFAEKNFDPTTDEKKMFQKFVSLKDFLFSYLFVFLVIIFVS